MLRGWATAVRERPSAFQGCHLKKASTNPDIRLLMLYCSQMSDAKTVSWGPTMLSSFRQKSRVGCTEAAREWGGKDRETFLCPQDGLAKHLLAPTAASSLKSSAKYSCCLCRSSSSYSLELKREMGAGEWEYSCSAASSRPYVPSFFLN